MSAIQYCVRNEKKERDCAPAHRVGHLVHEVVLAERENWHKVCAVLQRLAHEAASVAQREPEASGPSVQHLVLPPDNDHRRLTASRAVRVACACGCGCGCTAVLGGSEWTRQQVVNARARHAACTRKQNDVAHHRDPVAHLQREQVRSDTRKKARKARGLCAEVNHRAVAHYAMRVDTEDVVAVCRKRRCLHEGHGEVVAQIAPEA